MQILKTLWDYQLNSPEPKKILYSERARKDVHGHKGQDNP
jgi:hypothetical protein